MRKRFRVTAFIAGLSVLYSCIGQLSADEGHTAEVFQDIQFLLKEIPKARSSISPQEDKVSKITIYAYHEGELAAITTGTSVEELSMKLVAGKTYNLYCLANITTCPQFRYEEVMITHPFFVGDIDDMSDALPMSWNSRMTVEEGYSEVQIVLERMVAKIGFHVDKGMLDYMSVKSVRVCQTPYMIRPFIPQGNYAYDDSEVITADYAPIEDIEVLNQGGSVFFYALENCQGVLLPSNEDPWLKVPDSIDELVSSSCTYLEVTCQFPESDEYGVYCGEVVYRFYLGDDACSDFNVKRNSTQEITLYTTEEGLNRVSWRVDNSDLVFQGGVVEGYFVDNFHSADDMYVSEYASFEFDMEESAEAYWNQRGYEIVGLDENDNPLMSFDDYKNYGGGSYSCRGRALAPGYFDVWMINEFGKKVLCLYEGGRIKVPEVVIGNGDSFCDYDKVQKMDEDAEYMINGSGTPLCIYLTDDRGYNINQGAGCDCEFFDWQVVMKDSNNEVLSGTFFDVGEIEYGETADDSYVAMVSVGILNDGLDSNINKILSRSLGRGRTTLTINEESLGLSGSQQASIYADDIQVTLKSSSPYASYLGTDHAYHVDNPSLLPFCIDGWKVFSAKDAGVTSYYSAAYQAVDGVVECSPMFSSVIPSWMGDEPFYLSSLSEVRCSLDKEGDKNILYDGKYVYPADDSGITDAYLVYMIQADRRPLAAGGYQYRTEKVRYRMLDAWMLYDCKEPPSINVDVGQGYGTAVQIETFSLQKPIEVDIYFNAEHQLVAVASEPVTLNIDVYGNLKSHIRTVSGHDLILFSLKIRYYQHSDDFSSGMHEVSLSTSPVVVDESAVKNVLNYIRTIEYYSEYDGISAREVLKPYSMTLGIDIVPEDDRLVSVNFPESLIYRYENINYTYGEPPSTFNYKENNVPNAEAFVDGDVNLSFNVSYESSPELNHVSTVQ